MRAERAAAYLDLSKSTFLRLVEDGVMPQPIRIKGVVCWDRLDLDAAFEGFKGIDQSSENTMHKLLGMG
ncbi:hypothetical protein AS156_30865 [Bradyrhizobium macuxiense]|uniref:AlpA family transcriptional regulator n=2 Tax=Bradyrhizobium macuxiense TaxID=1755647 RepID=A0A109K2K7_9BRAD|nr:hypothetical protein AS156_30865 [Bradyrhizobium macuxiense]